MPLTPWNRLLLLKLLWLLVLSAGTASGHGVTSGAVTYDGRSLMINGRREMFFSGSIHYPRSTPDMWPEIILKAKHGGLNVIQTYVFWNVHEPVEGQFNFEGRYDLVKFIKAVWAQGMYVTLRIGPFIEAEWNFGGFPYWLREVDGIVFRTDNPPFKYHMEKFTKMIVDKMKQEKLFAPQGGPIILAQIENEYNSIQPAFREDGLNYVIWAGKMAVGLDIGVPWVMCKQNEAPDPVINSCNGRNCGDTFGGPNKPYKPLLWTENWTAQYRVFGDPPSQRRTEDIAFSVARFFSKNGTLANYYMYYGGTNFGRTSSTFTTTRYYDEGPMDEYGLQREPKWSHLRDLHSALRLSKKALLWGKDSVQQLGTDLEARIYEVPGSSVCAAFLCNNKSRDATTVEFRGGQYILPPHSISILPDCKTVVFNTGSVVSQHNARSYVPAKESNGGLEWEMFQEKIPTISDAQMKQKKPSEHLNLTRDTTDYLWYTTILLLQDHELPMRHDIVPVIQVASLGHALHCFVNNKYHGSGHGDNIEKSFEFKTAIDLQAGLNQITILAMTVGLPDSGVYLEHRLSGVHRVLIKGLSTGTLDISNNEWGHKVGMLGENLQVFTDNGLHRVKWQIAKGAGNKPVTWYKTYFNAPNGKQPVAIDLSSMGKGQVWINGESIGRYWVSYLTPLGKPSQSAYHIPRSFLKPTKNLLVIFEETGGNPEEILIVTVNRDTMCSAVSELHPPHVKSWKREDSEVHAVAELLKPHARLKCPNHKLINSIDFASFGNPLGSCGNYTTGSCHYPESKNIVEKACLGKTTCDIPVVADNFGGDLCQGTSKALAVQVRCTRNKASGK